jgi:flagellar basal-body rod modification protein FlgD
MTIDRLTSTTDTGSRASTSAPAAALGQDAFLTLLMTQLRYQDPTAPQADGEFLAQLAQFSTLEQLQTMNAKLDAIAELLIDADTTTTTAEVR